MIFEIINLSGTNFSEAQIEVLDNLAKAHREQKHVVFAPRRICQNINSADSIGLPTKSQFLSIGNKASELGGLIQEATIKVQIDFAENNPRAISCSANNIVVAHTALRDSESFQKTIFLCEDSQDCVFFENLAEYFCKKKGYSYKVELQHLHGGGSRTKREFEKIDKNSNPKLCLCLVDNDKKHPNDAIGETAKQFNSYKSSPMTHFEILDVHEIESLIPFNSICDLFEPNQLTTNQIKSADYLKELERDNHSSTTFFDLKKGLSITKAFSLDHRRGRFWEDLLKTNKPAWVKQECINNKQCHCTEQCHIIYGFGENLLHKFICYLEKITHQKIKELLSPSKDTHWIKWGEIIFWWGCAPNNRRIA